MNYIGPRDVRHLEDPLHPLLDRLLATQDAAEFRNLSIELRSMLHERIESLRKDAQSLAKNIERRKRRRDG